MCARERYASVVHYARTVRCYCLHKVHTVGLGDVSHGRVRPLMILLITASPSSKTKKDMPVSQSCAFGGTLSILSVHLLSAMRDFVFLSLVLRMGSLPARGSNTSIAMSHKLSERIPSNLSPASNEIISACVTQLFDASPAYRYECVASPHAQHASSHIFFGAPLSLSVHCQEEKKNGRNRQGDNDLRDEAGQGCIESVCEGDRD